MRASSSSAIDEDGQAGEQRLQRGGDAAVTEAEGAAGGGGGGRHSPGERTPASMGLAEAGRDSGDLGILITILSVNNLNKLKIILWVDVGRY